MNNLANFALYFGTFALTAAMVALFAGHFGFWDNLDGLSYGETMRILDSLK